MKTQREYIEEFRTEVQKLADMFSDTEATVADIERQSEIIVSLYKQALEKIISI